MLNDILNGQTVFAHTYITTGDDAFIAGSTTAVGGTTIGANAKVNKDVIYGTVIVQSAGAKIEQSTKQNSVSPPAPAIQDAGQGVSIAQRTPNAMTGATVINAGNIASDRKFEPGVYDVTGLLTTTAGITLTLDAQHQHSDFIFNVSSYLSFGAGTVVEVINGEGYNTRVIWNSGGYTSIGAKAEVVGTILATAYVSTGAYSTVTGSGESYGGVFSATSYVTVGANATVGSGND